MKKDTKTVVLVLAALAGVGCLVAGGVTFALVSAAASFGGTGEWSADAVPERELPALFGVRLPVKPLHYEGRQMGFQDAYFEVLVQLPPGTAERFLSSNHLVRGAAQEPAGSIDPDLVDRLKVLEPTTPPLEVTPLELPQATLPDGGTWVLHRSGELLEAPGVVWLHLTAFET